MMKAESMPLSKIIGIDQGAREHYHVPKYQREYSWGKRDWDRLVQDIDENDSGYFMGSVIVVRDGEAEKHGGEIIYDVVDGQQRLTTLSIMMAAIYHRLVELKEDIVFEDDDDRQDFENALASLRNKIVKKAKKGDGKDGDRGGWTEGSKVWFLRVQPSSQNNNLDDYKYILSDAGILTPRSKPRYHGVRAMAKAYKFFAENIPTDVDSLSALVTKIGQLNFVHISVGSQADAFTLFETLNNRGVPLSAIDIIKNKILSEMEKQHDVDIDQSYEQWQEVVDSIPDPSEQERFLRHYYNAFRWDTDVRIQGISRAIKSKIITIYEKLIKKDAKWIFDDLLNMAILYGQLVDPGEDDFDEDIREQLVDLQRINASPSYQMLMYLFSREEKDISGEDFHSKCLALIRKYYVRRNVTDSPGTKSLDQGHMNAIDACQKHIDEGSPLTFEVFRDNLLEKENYSTLDEFIEFLQGDMYSLNAPMTRYLLVKLDEQYHTREYAPNLWARNKKDSFVWTVEHVLPQTENIPDHWVAMIGDGDREQAEQVHWDNVDRLGNLTLSGYNSKLATASLKKKQELTDKKVPGHKIQIGYQNKLALNTLPFDCNGNDSNLATIETWNADAIESRTNVMVQMLVEMYKFDDIP